MEYDLSADISVYQKGGLIAFFQVGGDISESFWSTDKSGDNSHPCFHMV